MICVHDNTSLPIRNGPPLLTMPSKHGMTHLNFHFLRLHASHISHLKLFYIPIFLICIGCAGSSSRDQGTVSIADLRAQLQPLKKMGVYAGFDLKAGILYMANDSIERWLRLNQEGHTVQTIRYAAKPSGQTISIDRVRNFGFGSGR